MDNVLEQQGVPLTVFGGAVTEMAPEDLPEGASPFNQDCDYSPGSVFTRGGRLSQITYANLTLEKLTTFGQSIAGPFAPNETPWTTPNNITLNTPGTYAKAVLGTATVLTPGIVGVDATDGGRSGSSTTVVTGGVVSPTQPNDLAFFAQTSFFAFTDTSPGYTLFEAVAPMNIFAKIVSSPTQGTGNLSSAGQWAEGTVAFKFAGSSVPAAPTNVSTVSGGLSGTQVLTFPFNVTNGNIILVWAGANGFGSPQATVSDNKGNGYSLVFNAQSGLAVQDSGLQLFMATNVVGGAGVQVSVVIGNSVTGGVVRIEEYTAGAFGAVTPGVSQILQASAFNPNIPLATAVIGVQLEISGHQSSLDPSVYLQVAPANATAATVPVQIQLPTSDGTVFAGIPTSNWGLALTPALLNNPNFAFNITAFSAANLPVEFDIYAVKLKIFLSPSPPANMNWLKSYEQTSGQVDTLALDANGILWDENVTSNPNVLSGIFLNILPNTYAKSVTFDDIEYIAFSNLINGTDMPRQWNGTFLDRISMVGPGAPPSATTSSATNSIVSITQPPPASDLMNPGRLSGLLWSAGPGSTAPGNIVTVYYTTVSSLPLGDPNLVVGGNVALAGLGGVNSIPQLLNGVYTITSLGQGVPPGASAVRWYFTIQMSQTLFNNQANHIEPNAPFGTYQVTLATMTTAAQVPNLSVGGSFAITGTGGSPPSGYDGPWTVLSTPNASQLNITSTQLNGGVATYSYILVTGTAPVAGEFINVTNTLNGGGIFNVTNVAISAASPGSFSINLAQPNVSPAAETGSGIVFGTIFTFDPLVIVGNKTGGSIASTGIIGVGIRKVCYSFLTRSGFITQPSPIATFNILAGAGSITVSGILPGPSNVVARIVHFTGANGGNFFNIPQPVTVISNGSPQVNSSTYINDNVTTSATFSFSDGVLLAATAIDIPGNNLFSDMELGSCRGLLTYADRLFAWGEQNKIMNLRNLSFDGGIAGATVLGITTTYPPGWLIDPTNGGGVSLVNSPEFGFAVQIANTSGSTQATYGMLTQPAYQDEFLVPIVNSATTYSVRVTASCPTGASGGNLVIDLFSPSFNKVFGSFSIPLTSMTSVFQIFTGTLLTTTFAQVPKDLLIRQYATAIPNNVTVLVDRAEPFPTLQPSFSVQMRGSYAGNQEAFDLVTGACGPAQNQQPINGALTMYDLLYALKERSWYSTSDNGVTEPNKWNWKEVSQKVGTIGILSYDHGEGWALTGNREGVFFFEGGEPIKVSQEIQPLWDLINWKAGSSIWLRNDPEQRRFTVGVPIATPNQYMPEFPVNANPTTPNVVLMCNYRELNSGAALAQTGPIKSTFSGRIMSPEPARKWSFWNIASPYSDFIDRSNNQWPQWFGSGYADNKIFALDAATLSDDGLAINSFYVTYGFVKPEMQEAKNLGLFRMQFGYMTILAIGSGTLNPYVYPESPLNRPYALDQIPLPTFSSGDLEVGVNIKGNRFFVRWGTNAVGSGWRASKVVVALTQDSWSPIRGLTSAAF